MSQEKSDRLCQKIKAGQLVINQRNANAVKNAWAEAIFWNSVFDTAGLSDLPDPDDMAGQEKVFEEWLAKAYLNNFSSEEEVRAVLKRARQEIIQAEHK